MAVNKIQQIAAEAVLRAGLLRAHFTSEEVDSLHRS